MVLAQFLTNSRTGLLVEHDGARFEDPSVLPLFCGDLRNGAVAAAGSIAFPCCLQFLIHAGVKKIYIVGADVSCSDRINEPKNTNGNDYVKQNFIARWLEFRAWAKKEHADVELVSVNPVGLHGMFKECLTYPQFRFHVLGIPATITSKEFVHCAFTQKVQRFSQMMTDAGHTVYHYGHKDSDVTCTEHIPVVTNEAFKEEFGTYDWKNTVFQPKNNGACNREFTKNTIPALRARYQKGDFILCWYGVGHQKVAEAMKGAIIVEPSVGYKNTFAKQQVFESYAHMHHTYGSSGVANPRFYDAVIPGFVAPEEFKYSAEKENFVLYCGRLVQRKGLKIAIDACVRTGTKLVIGGQGNIENLKLGKLPDNIECVGYLDAEKRKDYMSRAKALICPTQYAEPFGYIAIEAAMSGTPVISTDWGGFSETVWHSVTGFRCRTMAQFDYALNHVHFLSPETCRKWAVINYSTAAATIRYSEYFLRLGGVFSGNDFNGKLTSARPIIDCDLVRPSPSSTPAKIIPYQSNELVEQYAKLHKEKVYGVSSEDMEPMIAAIVEEVGPLSILDYGCGQSRLIDRLSVAETHKYDPAIPGLDNENLPNVDMVLCTDVLEHIPKATVGGTVKRIAGLAPTALFNISLRLASEMLPNGQNAHCTVLPAEEWCAMLSDCYKDIRVVKHTKTDLTVLATNGEGK